MNSIRSRGMPSTVVIRWIEKSADTIHEEVTFIARLSRDSHALTRSAGCHSGWSSTEMSCRVVTVGNPLGIARKFGSQ